jgi:hypothetical protein
MSRGSVIEYGHVRPHCDTPMTLRIVAVAVIPIADGCVVLEVWS